MNYPTDTLIPRNKAKLLDVAKEILSLYPKAAITGTLMLMLRGIDLGRAPQDIDIIYDGNTNDIDLSQFGAALKDTSSDGTSSKYEYKGVAVDVLSTIGERFDILNGWRLGSFEGLVKAKIKYAKQTSHKDCEKHKADLLKMGFSLDCPQIDSEEVSRGQ